MPLINRNGVWYWRHWINGREFTGSTGLPATKRHENAARKCAEEKRRELTRPAEPGLPEIAFEEAAAAFLEWCFDVEYRNQESTALRIRSSFRSLRDFFAGRPVSQLTENDVEDYKTYRATVCQVQDCTLNNDLNNLSLFFRRWAIRRGIATANPVSNVKKPSNDAMRIYVIPDAELERYFAEAAKRESPLHDVARLILLQGCRPEEIMALRQADVDLKQEQIHINGGKTRAARRSLDLTAESVRILHGRLKQPGWWVFPSSRYGAGKHITKLNGTHERVCRDAGATFLLYDLRHTFATRMAESGCDLPTLAAILGHNGLRMVMRYVHPTAKHRKEAMLQFERSLKPGLQAVSKAAQK